MRATVPAPLMGPTEWLLLVVLSVLWGGSFLFAKIAVTHVPPLVVVWLRVCIAAAILLALLPAFGVRLPRDGRFWREVAVMGMLNNVAPFALIFWGQQEIGASLAGILNATTPFFTVLLAHLLTRDERITGAKLAGLLIGLAGVVAMIGPDALASLGGAGLGTTLAQLAIVGAAFSYGCANIFGRRFRDRPPMALACGQLSMSALILTPIILTFQAPWSLPVPPAEAIAAIAALALASTALAYVIFFRILAKAGATNVALVTFLVPASAILLGALVLGERLAPMQMLGLAGILCGLAAIDGRVWRWTGLR
ncbi:DMT family transporter [Oceanibaculum indicum]|uniref:Putative membrane protein n=1 Tax=Oceanibaculum indicum TaxID=526216 RepID=A0A420WCV4_9PROT|nr:DMT family transporter [Oceanibaculum indicum]RKQ68732.1 putative membrane protein [Oceanibaculum indicum]